MAGKSSGKYRSAKTGRYVSKSSGKSNPRTTVKESSGKRGSTGGRYRSAISGRFVREKYGKANPKITTKEK